MKKNDFFYEDEDEDLDGYEQWDMDYPEEGDDDVFEGWGND